MAPAWRAAVERNAGEMHAKRAWPIADDRAKANMAWTECIEHEQNVAPAATPA